MKQTPQLIRRSLAVLHLLAIIVILYGCAGILGGITYYDPTTYKNLTDLKPQVLALYNTFTGDPVDSDEIDVIRLKLAQVYEYEKGKGEKNAETIEQIQIIQEMFAFSFVFSPKNSKRRFPSTIISLFSITRKKRIYRVGFSVC